MDMPIFENVKFSELFTIVSKEDAREIQRMSPAWEWTDSQGYTFKHRKGEDKSKIGNYFYFQSVDVPYKESIWVNPSPMLVKWICDNTLIINHDTTNFKAVIFKDGSMDVYFQYGQIIGGHYLGRFHISDLD